MPAHSSISYEALPAGDGIYRLYWGGLIQLSNSEDDAPKSHVWLREIDRQGDYIPKVPAIRVVQSAGAILGFHIGSLWQNKAPFLDSKLKEPDPIEFEIEAQPSWCPVLANQKHMYAGRGQGGRSHDWLNPSDYKLTLDEGGGVSVAAYHSWVVPMKSVNGEELIVPCYEIFRAFYAGSSELAWRLLTAPWSAIKSHFLRNAEFHKTAEGKWAIRLEPETGMSKGVLPYLGALVGSSAMRGGANKVHADLISSTQEYGTQTAWIRAVPPFLNQRFRIKACVVPLTSRPGVMVTHIVAASFPLQDTPLHYVQDEYISDLTDASAADTPDDAQFTQGQRDKYIDTANVSKSGQHRATKRRLHLGIGRDFWLDAPRPTKEVRQVQSIKPPIIQPDEAPDVLAPYVGVGGTGDRESPPHGSLEQSDDETTGRMAAIQDLVSSLALAEKLKWVEWPVVNCTAIECNKYCALPIDQGDEKSRTWAKGNGFDGGEPPRLAWVIRITVAGQNVYWVEIEHQKRGDHFCSIALTVLSGKDLDEATLRQVLNACVEHKGIWPKFAPHHLASIIKWSKGKNYQDGNGGLRASTILNRLRELGVVTARSLGEY